MSFINTVTDGFYSIFGHGKDLNSLQMMSRAILSFFLTLLLIKGEPSILYENGQLKEENMRKARVSIKDLQEGVRQRINENTLEHVKEIVQERNGEITVVRK